MYIQIERASMFVVVGLFDKTRERRMVENE
jgi:hypothetical protein